MKSIELMDVLKEDVSYIKSCIEEQFIFLNGTRVLEWSMKKFFMKF